MRSRHLAFIAAAVLVGVFTAATEAQAQVAAFKSIRDAVPGKFFDAALTAPDPTNPNRLVIGIDSGIDPTTFLANDFRASALAFSNRMAMDTIAFKVVAPTGFYIASITYSQRGTGFTSRTSIEMGNTMWVVNGKPKLLKSYTSDPNLDATVDLTSTKPSSVPVSISPSLFASTGSVAITSADVTVKLLPR